VLGGRDEDDRNFLDVPALASAGKEREIGDAAVRIMWPAINRALVEVGATAVWSAEV
jgi:hypothetical protein